MRSSGGVGPAARGGDARAPGACSRARPAERSAPACWRGPRATATRSASTWAAPPATSASSRTARCAAPTRASSTGARSSCRWSTSTRSAPAAARSRWRDRGGALRVGPRSAGAEPGPACYGRGGTRADGHRRQPRCSATSPPDSALAGGVELDAEAAAAAIGGLGAELGLAETETAAGIVRVANQEMVRALRVVTVERGVDPRGFALMPFGGAGPMHAAALAAELEIGRILCPRASGVLSALGLLASDRRRDTTRTVMLAGDELTAERIAAEVERARRARSGRARRMREIEVVCEMRYRGQSFELPVPADERPTRPSSPRRSPPSTRRATATAIPRPRVELVNLRVAAVEPGPEPAPRAASRRGDELERSTRRAWFERRVGRGRGAARRARRRAARAGPCVFELPEATLVLPPGLERRGGRARDRSSPTEACPMSVDRPGRRSRSWRWAARRLRGDGRGADPLGALAEHQGAPRLLDRALRRRPASW